MQGLHAELAANLLRRQYPGQIGGDHATVFQRVAGAGDHAPAYWCTTQFREERGHDVGKARIVGAAVLAIVQHRDRLARVIALAYQRQAHVRAAHIGGNEGFGARKGHRFH